MKKLNPEQKKQIKWFAMFIITSVSLLTFIVKSSEFIISVTTKLYCPDLDYNIEWDTLVISVIAYVIFQIFIPHLHLPDKVNFHSAEMD